MLKVQSVTQEDKIEIVQTHYAVIKQALGGDDNRACDFLAWAAKFFSENPQVLQEISNPQTRDKVFSMAIGMMNNPLFKMF